jgi:hypothetical protein
LIPVNSVGPIARKMLCVYNVLVSSAVKPISLYHTGENQMISTNDFALIGALDFSAIKAKLMHKAGEGWSLERANAVESEYRRFLYLMKIFPNEQTAPLVDVDTFWHYHILDTMKYAVDCEQAFGYFLHHYPYVGMGAEEDDQERLDAGARMQALYEATFGEAYPALQAHGAEAGASAFCGAAVRAQTAFCGAAVKAQTAFCGAAVKAQTAFCGAAVKAQPAFCGAAIAPAAGKQTAEAALAA